MDKETVLGYLVDEEGGPEETQEEVNEISLYAYYQNCLLECVKNKVSMPQLNAILEEIEMEENIEYWNEILDELCDYYSLEHVRNFDSYWTVNESYSRDIRGLLIYLKKDIKEFILSKKITEETTRDEMEEILEDANANELFLKGIKYISGDDYIQFLTTITRENREKEYIIKLF